MGWFNSSPPSGRVRVWGALPGHPSAPGALSQNEFNAGGHFNEVERLRMAKGSTGVAAAEMKRCGDRDLKHLRRGYPRCSGAYIVLSPSCVA